MNCGETDPDSFKIFMHQLQEAKVRSPPLILLNREAKTPIPGPNLKMPDGTLNPARAVSPMEALRSLTSGGNVGIYGSPKGLTILDFDVKNGKLVLPQDVCEKLIEVADTFTVQTKSGGYHLYFRSDGSTGNPHIYHNGVDVGECRCDWQYVVAPGSYVPIDTDKKGCTEHATGIYTIYRDRPIRKFELTVLPVGVSLGKKEKTSKNNSRNCETSPTIEPSGPDFKNPNGQSLDFFRRNDQKLDTWLRGANEEDRSRADYGVACKLAFYGFTEGDAAQILRIYRPYEKTNRDEYVDNTISKAFTENKERANQRRHGVNGRVIPEIIVTGKPMRDITNEALASLEKSNDPRHIFVRNGSLTRILLDEIGRPKIDIIDVNSLRGIMDRSADFGRLKKSKEGVEEFIPERPPLDVVQDIQALGNWAFPALKGIICVPIILDDGTIVDSKGYEPRTRLFYSPTPSLEIPIIPDHPTQEDIDSAVDLLHEVFCDFPFDSEASRANVIGLLITGVLRPLIDGPVPLALIDKPQAGTGASLIASVIALVATGQMGAMMPPPVDDEEMRKKITARLLSGDSLLIIDNLESKLSSPSLAALLTTGSWNDRILGQTRTISMEVCATVIVTGNNIRLGLDMPRRCYHIRMDAQRAQPWDRSDFEHPNLLAWVKSERGRILAAIYILIRAWIQAGKPKPNGIAALGSFERWRNFVGGILEVAGIPGFLGNLEKMYAETDVDTPQWTLFIETLYGICGGGTFSAADIEASLESEKNHTLQGTGGGLCLTEVLPDQIADAWFGKKNFTRVLGTALSKQKDKQFPNGLRITKGGGHARAIYWQIQKGGESSN